MEVIILGVFSCSSDGFLAEMHLDLFTDLPCQTVKFFMCTMHVCKRWLIEFRLCF